MPPVRSIFCALFISAAAAMTAESAQPVKSPKSYVVAHRGLLRHAPENTLANFRACLELRLGFEFDVLRAGDGTLVCIHDATVDRTTDGSGKVSELTLAELKQLDAGSWFDPAFRDERIPTIEEVFALLAEYPQADVLVAVDLKAADSQVEADVLQLAKKYQVVPKLLFIGRTITLPEVRRRLKQAEPKAATACVANTPAEFPAALKDEADWVYLRYVPSRDEVAQVHAAGKRVFIAGPTVAGLETENWRVAQQAGVDGVLTDYALHLKRVLRTPAID
jgi:glycerophosphoryl diester phosphodiesterase